MQILWSPKATDSNISGALSRQAMGTLKSVCSSWFALISRDKYEHTLLRVPIQQQGLGKILVKSVVETSFTD